MSKMLYFLRFLPQGKRLWLVQTLLHELLQRANPTQVPLKRTRRRLEWEEPTQGSGFGNPLCFCRSLSSVTFRSGHADPLLCQCYKLLINYLAATCVLTIPGSPQARIGLSHYQGSSEGFSKSGSAFPSTAEPDSPAHPARRLRVSCPHRPDRLQSCSSCQRKAVCTVTLQSSFSVSPGSPFLCFSFHCDLMCAGSWARAGISTLPKEVGLPFFPNQFSSCVTNLCKSTHKPSYTGEISPFPDFSGQQPRDPGWGWRRPTRCTCTWLESRPASNSSFSAVIYSRTASIFSQDMRSSLSSNPPVPFLPVAAWDSFFHLPHSCLKAVVI